MMKLHAFLAGCVLAVASALPASAIGVQYFANLNGASEAPPNASPGLGTAVITVDVGLRTMRVEASFAGLLAGTTAAHIHCCTAVANTGTASVATQTPYFDGFPIGVTSGTYDRLFDMSLAASWNATFITANGGTPLTAFAALVAGLDAGKSYFNIHSSQFGGGEIRGFLAPVPEPETYALLALGLGVLALAGRRRRAG